jgi:creatinine amidohydrolase/Fe(II)-dependent formamide hydrolase-like protein
VQGQPSLATAEKGKAFFRAAVDECVRYVRELLDKPLPVRREPRETVE